MLDFLLHVLVVAYTARVYLIEVKVKLLFTCFLWTNYYFVINSIHAVYFVNNVVVWKALMV